MIAIQSVTTEYQTNPLGLDNPAPRLSWILQSDQRNQSQSAYQILAASSEQLLAAGTPDLWDSGRVNSDRNVNVTYAGKPLASAQRVFWTVRAWDQDNQPSPWSAPAWFEMGLLAPGDWKGQWISAAQAASAPLLRKAFTLPGPVASARLYISGLGFYELSLNARRVGDRMMDPAGTWYDQIIQGPVGARCLYVAYDVTDLLSSGENVIGVTLAHGWYSSDDGNPSSRTPFAPRPVLMLQLDLRLADGRCISVSSDTSWKSSAGPVTANDISAGEHYDARLEQAGWNAPGFDDAAWSAAIPAAKAPAGRLVAMNVEPVRIVQRLRPIRMLDTGRGSVIFDMGQYVSGWTELRVRGPRGAKVALRHAGRVNYEASALDSRNNLFVHTAHQTDTYTLKGEGLEVWHPRFTVHGFRHVEVIGYPGQLTLDSVEGHAVNSDVLTAGQFACSNDMVNRVHHNVSMTFRGSFQGIPQDAADRAERVAWLGDPGFVAEDYIVNFHTARFWAKWLDDIRDAAKSDGAMPFIAPPNWVERSYHNWPCWEVTYTLFVWHVWRYYDDTALLADHYAGIRSQLERFRRLAEDLILPEPLGDHLEPDGPAGISSFAPTRTPKELTGTAYFHLAARIVAQAASVLGRRDDAEHYAQLAEQIKAAYIAKFFNPETNQFATGSQTSNAVSLYLDLVPADRRDAVLANLVKDIESRGNRLSTGIIGTDALEQCLPSHARPDVMFALLTQTAYPSWGYGVVNGQTTISEDFECSTKHSVSMKMFGSTEKFIFQNLAGLAPAPDSLGYSRLRIAPQPVGNLTWARCSYLTPRGLAATDWRRSPTAFHLKLTVPVNSRAEILLPTLGLSNPTLTESGKPLPITHQLPGAVLLNVGSGTYNFTLSAT